MKDFFTLKLHVLINAGGGGQRNVFNTVILSLFQENVVDLTLCNAEYCKM